MLAVMLGQLQVGFRPKKQLRYPLTDFTYGVQKLLPGWPSVYWPRSGSSFPKSPLTDQTLIHQRGRKTITFSRDGCRQAGLAGSGTLQREGWQKHSFSAFQRRYCMSFPLGIAWAFPENSKLLSRPQTPGYVIDINNISQALCMFI